MKFELIENIGLGLVVKIASLGNLRRYWIKFIPLCYINFSSMTVKRKVVMTENKNNPMEHVPLERKGVTFEKLLNPDEAGTLHNPDFKGVEFDRFRKEAGLNSFNLTPKKWIGKTFGKGDTAQAVPQATRLRSMTVDEKTEQTSCCDSLRSFEGAVSSVYLEFYYLFVKLN